MEQWAKFLFTKYKFLMIVFKKSFFHAITSYFFKINQVKANDPDCGNPCHLTYDIIWGDPVIPRVFRIDQSTGEVFLLAPLESRPYVFSVKVTDSSSGGRKKRSLAAKDAYTTVTINPAA